MDISEADLDKHCYLNTVKKGKIIFLHLIKREQKQSESYKNAVLFHPTKTSSTHWSVTPSRG